MQKKGFSGLTFVMLAYVLISAIGGAVNIKNHLVGLDNHWIAPLYAAVAGIFIVVSVVILMQLSAVFNEK
ncbi:MAG: hypothetical protein AB1805_14135 [Nitrospirota bacterium]